MNRTYNKKYICRLVNKLPKSTLYVCTQVFGLDVWQFTMCVPDAIGDQKREVDDSYRRLWAALWVLGIELGSSKSAASAVKLLSHLSRPPEYVFRDCSQSYMHMCTWKLLTEGKVTQCTWLFPRLACSTQTPLLLKRIWLCELTL